MDVSQRDQWMHRLAPGAAYRRLRRGAGALTLISLGLSSCSSGVKVLNTDQFISSMDNICRTASRAIGNLDQNDPATFPAAIKIMTTGFNDLGRLIAPRALKSDFEDFVSNLDDQITQATRLAKATKDKDDAGAAAAAAKMDKLVTAGDGLATSIGAQRCVGIGDNGATAGSTPYTSTDSTSDSASDTATRNTPLPLISSPDIGSPTDTSSSSGAHMTMPLAGVYPVPAGYTWDTVDPVDATQLYTDSVIGSAVKSYSFGRLRAASDGTLAEVYIVQLTGTWTQPLIDAYLSWESVRDGVDTKTPGGIDTRQKVGAYDGLDAVVTHGGNVGIAIVTSTGTDGLPILDAVVTAAG